MIPKIIYDDEDLLVLLKPSGWITNDAITVKDQPVIQSWLSKSFNYPLAKDREFRSGIVHRLDKETSGILLIAKTTQAFQDLQSQFKNREVKKTYTALAHGKLEPGEGTVKAPVGRLPWRRDRFGILPGGRDSETSYEVQNYFKNKKGDLFSLVTLNPKTGRTHQIRIHLKYLGHPIVSDDFYAGRKTARKDRLWCPRLFLHASGIKFTHPTSGKEIKFKSDLPDDLVLALKTLENLIQTP